MCAVGAPDVSPLLAARSGLGTAESSFKEVAIKVADVVLLDWQRAAPRLP